VGTEGLDLIFVAVAYTTGDTMETENIGLDTLVRGVYITGAYRPIVEAAFLVLVAVLGLLVFTCL